MTATEKFLKKQIDNRKHIAHQLEMSYNEILEKDIPEPVYIFKVGDRVVYGAWEYTEVLDVFQNGKFYKCHSCTISRNTNKGDVWNEKAHYLPWFEAGVYRTSDEIAAIDRLEEDRDIFFNYMQRDMMSLLSMMSNKYGIDLDPEYQRGNVWSLEQKVNLVDSIFKNVDIGKFAVIKRPWGNNPSKPLTPKLYEMLDGKQRLTAIWEYYCGRFKYKGKYFYELHPRDQSHFKHYTISYAETEPLTKEQTYRYFLKLNTTGTPVDSEHIAKVRKLWLDSKLNS